MTVEELLREMVSRLIKAGYDRNEARSISNIVIDDFKKWSPSEIIINYKTSVDDAITAGILSVIDKVAEGTPVQYVLSKARFYGIDFKVTPAVLIPRPETEELVELIVKENPEPDLRVLDVGTGSGCIAIVLARYLRFPSVTAIDISSAALAVAMENAKSLKTKIKFLEEDIFHFCPPSESFDIIVSNPPYICENEKKDMEPLVLEHEPHEALFVPDDDPLLFYRRISLIAATALSPGGKLYFEINPLFSSELKSLLNGLGFHDIKMYEDISHRNRFISAIKPHD